MGYWFQSVPRKQSSRPLSNYLPVVNSALVSDSVHGPKRSRSITGSESPNPFATYTNVCAPDLLRSYFTEYMRVVAHLCLWGLGLRPAETQTTEGERDCLARHAHKRNCL